MPFLAAMPTLRAAAARVPARDAGLCDDVLGLRCQAYCGPLSQAQQRAPGLASPPAVVPEVACVSALMMCPSGSMYPGRQSFRRGKRRWNARSWWPSTAAPALIT
jgi:hypothetical protein